MGSNISLDFILDVISLQEAIQNVNNINWVLEIVHQGEESLNSRSFVFQNAVEVGQAVSDQHVITRDIFDDFNKAANSSDSLILIAWFVKEMSLSIVISLQELS